ncbi:MAG: RNase adapter RapZ [Vicinamibacterales bacterium]
MTQRRRIRAGALGRRAARFVVVTGMSGAGKSQAIRALEDLGYFCVDNLPVALIPTFADLTLTSQGEIHRAAVVVDVREGTALARFPTVYSRLKRQASQAVRLMFLDAGDAALLRRFSETRRPHPLAAGRSVAEAIRVERRLLQPMRRLADQILDTSTLNVHDLRRRILESTSGTGTAAPLVVNILSFGFGRGVPPDADLLFDVRFLPNPHFVTALRPWTGRSARVARFVLRAPAARRFLQLTSALLTFLIPQYIAEGKSYLTVAIGCTGGRHRSVAIAEALGQRLRRLKGIERHVRHRDAAEG